MARFTPREIKVEVKTELDPDYGNCLYLYIDGEKMPEYVRDEKGAEPYLFKANAVRLFEKTKSLEKELEKVRTFRDRFRELVGMVT